MTHTKACATCDHWQRDATSGPYYAPPPGGTCYGVPPLAWKGCAFPTTHKDDRCPLWTKKEGE